MIATMLSGSPDAEDVRRYFRALRRAAAVSLGVSRNA